MFATGTSAVFDELAAQRQAADRRLDVADREGQRARPPTPDARRLIRDAC